ncbi:MAG TPA: HypC/HybG/HupF family hydrogenase formation chaperone [Armatimonadota bacterium]|nr:HypC/HybG/HupF family hydrogenase formation chaperone [Armatimonadota bacterium]
MCLAIPMKVVEIRGKTARVEQEGVSREARIDFLEGIEVGDFVLVHAGIAIQRVRPEDAEETLRLMRMIADEIR